DVEEARGRLLGEQLPDGSWAQLADMSGDAYATATVLVALRRAGLDVRHEGYQKGVKYLLGSQKEDGAWIVQTRSRHLQRRFDNGDPGGKSQFVSVAATNGAVLALLGPIPLGPLRGGESLPMSGAAGFRRRLPSAPGDLVPILTPTSPTR